MKNLLLVMLSIYFGKLFASQITIDLKTDIERALNHSYSVKVSEQEFGASSAKKDQLRATNYPSLSFDGQYKYIESVPSMNLPMPIGKTISLGQQDNYSVGISANVLVTDFGQTSKQIKSLEKEAQAVKSDSINTKKQTRLLLEQTYLKIVFLEAQLNATLDAWMLAQNQSSDMKKRFVNGVTSKLDYTKSSKDAYHLELQFLKSKRDYTEAIREWALQVGLTLSLENEYLPQSVVVRMKSIENKIVSVVVQEYQFNTASNIQIATHPLIKKLSLLEEATILRDDAILRSYLPRITASARLSKDYPFGGADESVNQTTAMIGFSMPIWDGNQRTHQRTQNFYLQKSIEFKREQLKEELNQKLETCKLKLVQIEQELEVAQNEITSANELAKLAYQSYLNGKTNFLDVQSANLLVLESKTQLASLEYTKSLLKTQINYLGESYEE